MTTVYVDVFILNNKIEIVDKIMAKNHNVFRFIYPLRNDRRYTLNHFSFKIFGFALKNQSLKRDLFERRKRYIRCIPSEFLFEWIKDAQLLISSHVIFCFSMEHIDRSTIRFVCSATLSNVCKWVWQKKKGEFRLMRNHMHFRNSSFPTSSFFSYNSLLLFATWEWISLEAERKCVL